MFDVVTVAAYHLREIYVLDTSDWDLSEAGGWSEGPLPRPETAESHELISFAHK